jgi:hypothetical protein
LQSDVDEINGKISKGQAIVDEYKSKGMQTKEDLEAEAAKEDASKEVLRALREAKKSNEPYINKEHIQRNMEELAGVQ